MQIMKLLSLTLKNFKGCRDFIFRPNGHNVDVYGDNAAGKTTIYDAFLWLLFGKDSHNRKDFEIKTLTPDGQVIHGLDHEVEGIFEINGTALTLRKRYAENWTKKRGSATKEFTGHTVDHFIDCVPVKAGEYADKIAEIADEDAFRLLTNPAYFNTVLHWQKRREVLLEVCGDVSDADVVASSVDLKGLPAILGSRTLDEHRRVILSRRTEINKELEKIPVRIDEAERGLPAPADVTQSQLNGEKAELKKQLKEKQAEVARIKSGGEIAEKTKMLREVESQLLDIRNKHGAAVDVRAAGKRQEINALKDAADVLRREIQSAERYRDANLFAIQAHEKDAETLRKLWHEVNGREFTLEQDGACSACGQTLPAERLQEAKEKALASFNHQKAMDLEAISTKGKRCKADIESLKAANEMHTKTITDAQSKLALLDADVIGKMEAEIVKIIASATDPATSPEYKAAQVKIQALESEIDALRAGDRELLTMAEEEVCLLESKISRVDDVLAHIDRREKGQTRIKELAAEEKKLAAEYEKLERELYLADLFVKAKVDMLEEKINSKFKLARFKLFKENINGGVEPCCETVLNGVPYNSGLNRGHQFIVGLDIINTLAEHYAFAPPIFLDNAEAVTRLPETRGQQIRLIVSAKDKQLRVEIEGQNTLFGEVA